MSRCTALIPFLFLSIVVFSQQEKPEYPSFNYEAARAHELKPHRRTIPVKGVREGFNQLRLTLTVSPAGDVLDAEAGGDKDAMKFWPQLQEEVRGWRFAPFEKDGRPVTAEVEEYVDLVPPEKLPQTHVPPPILKPDSKIVITLSRSGCFGSCPSYDVTVSNDTIMFEGRGFVAASGKHTDIADSGAVRDLAKRFIDADFYSMNPSYSAAVTDNPTYILSITIDGAKKVVQDYVGSWVGMPAVISELEDAVDELAETDRWINAEAGLIRSLQSESFDFHSERAQAMLREAAGRGQVETVRALLQAGVPLKAVPRKRSHDEDEDIPRGWLTSASMHPEVLKVFIDAGVSKNDQRDKDLALASSARSGHLDAVKALITYGANPNADLSKLTVEHDSGGMTVGEEGAGSILIYAAESGTPELIREILRYHPKLEARDREGKTAIFYASDYRNDDEEGARVECVRILAQAGANVNARDKDGNTPLHETFLTEVEEELLRLGADVNARNNDGETPIFTNVDQEAIPLFIRHGADLSIRNNKGENVFEDAKHKGPLRQEALRIATQAVVQH